MNTQSVRSAIAKWMSLSLVAALIVVANPFNSKAADNKEKENAFFSEKQVSVQYAGAGENSVSFRIQLENPAAQKFSLIVKDDAGDVIFQQQFSDVHFNKTVQLLKETSEMHPTFVIRMGNQEVSRSFAVNSSARVVEDVVVTKL
jgi:hypothetical protein